MPFPETENPFGPTTSATGTGSPRGWALKGTISANIGSYSDGKPAHRAVSECVIQALSYSSAEMAPRLNTKPSVCRS